MSTSAAEVVVAGHTCLDIIPEFHRAVSGAAELLAPGGMTELGPAVVATGGVVTNTGLALHRLGVPVRLVGKVGDDLFGRAVVGILRAHDPRLAGDMIVEPGAVTSYSIVISPPGIDRQFLHCTGANATFTSADVPDAALSGARLMHFGYPTAMRRMRADDGAETEALLRRARAAGLTTSLDIAMPDPAAEAGGADWATFFRRVTPQVDLLTPSLEELLFALDRPRFQRLQARAAEGHVAAGADGALLSALGARLVELGAAVVMITLGSEGLYLRTTADASRLAAMGQGAPADPQAWRGRELLVPCFDVAVAGTTGAGDSCAAGLLTGLLRGLGPEEAATAAAAVGAACVERPDATSGVGPWDEIRGRVDAGWPRRPLSLTVDGWTWDADGAVCRGPDDAAPAL